MLKLRKSIFSQRKERGTWYSVDVCASTVSAVTHTDVIYISLACVLCAYELLINTPADNNMNAGYGGCEQASPTVMES